MRLIKNFIKFFEIRIGWFFINGRKMKDWEDYIEEKYNTGR